MGKFISAKFNSKCIQTGKEIKKGDHIYYFPGRGAFSSDSDVYKDHRGNQATADHVQAQEDAYFDNFCSRNNI
jgi:hypothetical protein